MRAVETHKVNNCNDNITIAANDPVTESNCPAGVCHEYAVTVHRKTGPQVHGIIFQNGPIAEVGTNGLTHEVLLAIVADRLEGFQAGPFACVENADALMHVRAAMRRLHDRTKARLARGVEGTHTV